MQNYLPLIEDVIIPQMAETVYAKDKGWLETVFTKDPNSSDGGSNIVRNIRTSVTSNVANYDRTDVDPDAGDFTTVQASWAKIYTHTAVEVHNIDLNEARNKGTNAVTSLLQDAFNVEYPQLSQKLYNNIYTQLKADVDSAAAYSDNSISRSTYPTLASYEEATNTQVTLAILRTCKNTTVLNKLVNVKDYTWLMEQAVYNPFMPLAAAQHTWNTTGVKGQDYAAGYQPVGSWEGNDVQVVPGMTTGDVFFVRPKDIYVREHRTLEVEQKESGRDSQKFVMRTGWNLWVDNPGFQAKMTDKD